MIRAIYTYVSQTIHMNCDEVLRVFLVPISEKFSKSLELETAKDTNVNSFSVSPPSSPFSFLFIQLIKGTRELVVTASGEFHVEVTGLLPGVNVDAMAGGFSGWSYRDRDTAASTCLHGPGGRRGGARPRGGGRR